MSIRQIMARTLMNRGYDNWPDTDEIFNELLDELEEAVNEWVSTASARS